MRGTYNKQKAIDLRKHGLSYSDILRQVPVAKSTLASWLKSIGLSKEQKQALTKKKLDAARRGAETKRRLRIAAQEKIWEESRREIPSISKKELWLMGVMLYWAEGSKEKECRPGLNVQFSNSDSAMIKLFLKWLFDICRVEKERISFDIFIHENHKFRIDEVISHWSEITGFPKNWFTHIYFKKNKILTKRKNTGNSYFGVVKVHVKASSMLNRRITGWIMGIEENCY